jgi:hypothetical protein
LSSQHAHLLQAPSHQQLLLGFGGLIYSQRIFRQGVDAYDISDPVDILPELRSFDDEVANTAKWSVRRDILTKLKTLAGASNQPTRLSPVAVLLHKHACGAQVGHHRHMHWSTTLATKTLCLKPDKLRLQRRRTWRVASMVTCCAA